MKRRFREAKETALYKFSGTVSLIEDDYEDGESTGRKQYYDISESAKSIKKLINEINISCNHVFSEDLSDWGASTTMNDCSEIWTDSTVTAGLKTPTEEQIQRWKNRNFKLYNAHIQGHIYKISTTDLTEEDFDSFGFELE